MPEQLHFRISSALKDIIGKDLITDDYIAVFELVKNAYDAYAQKVDIFFENIYSENAKIIIKDDGKGMDLDDIYNKWLFVAYSAKRQGTEDNTFDYRDRINTSRTFAGAKGIGRFSCDRLGKSLYLETTKHAENARTEVLITDWEKFENSLEDEFVDISVLHETKEKSNFELEHGTVLEISELRSNWERQDFLKLKDALAKLINPSNDNSEDNFKIFIHVPEEKENDNQKEHYYEKVNGEVKNFIFETLGLKTTKICAEISEDGEFITTELRDGGTLIYKVKEKNPNELLDNIRFTVYYLNRSAKSTFARRMGLPVVQYGHIFLYRNGFRIYPYGEPGEDPLKVDVRKAQGYNRYLGNREIIGSIEIFSQTDQLKETSSRGDGLIKTKTFDQLEAAFWDVLKRLEKYVVEVQQWGLSIEDDNNFTFKSRVSDLIAKLTGSNDIIDFTVNDNFLEILEASQIESAETIVKNLTKIASESGNDELVVQANRALNKLEEVQKARIQAEQQLELERERAEQATERLKEQISENLFLKSINTTEFQEVISLLHHIGIYAGTVDGNLKGISLRIQNEIPLSNEELYDIIRLISFETKKILNIVAFATKANFKLKTEQIEVELNEYIREYIQNIIPTTTDKDLQITVKDLTKRSFKRLVKPIEINIIIDNIINNAKKVGSSEILIVLAEQNDNLIVRFTDNGPGILEENIKRIYDFGFTTTDGTGIGLYHVKEIIKSLHGSITVENNKTSKGVTFALQF